MAVVQAEENQIQEIVIAWHFYTGRLHQIEPNQKRVNLQQQ